MKKFIFIIILLAVTFAAAQEPKSDKLLAREFINKAIENTDAVIVQEIDLEGEKFVTLVTSAPDYYDIKLVVATFNQLVSNYSNVTYAQNWKKHESYYMAFIRVGEHLILASWNPGVDTINYSY